VPQESDAFAGRFRRLLEDRGFSVRDFAELGGWAPSTVQAWRNGKSLPREGKPRRLICSLLETRPGYLFRGEGDE
jgi:transcriptional regulator with XRE-family HTH domain